MKIVTKNNHKQTHNTLFLGLLLAAGPGCLRQR